MTSTSWGTEGVGLDDDDAEATAEDSLDWYNEYPTWKTYNITALTQKWVDGTDDNYGVLLWATNEDDYTDKDEKWVYSSEYTGDTSKRPELYVKYTVDPLVVYEYDALSRLKKADYVSDVDLINTYDPNRGWLTNRDYTTTGSGDLFTFDNIYDAAGNVTKHRFEYDESGLDSMEYTYNNLHRLTTYKYGGSTIRSYGYDDNGNFTTFTGKTLTYGYDNNRLTDDGSRDFTFDQAGRVDTITSTGSTILTYDIFSNMRTYGNDSYTYDAFNQRLMKTEEGVKTHYITSGPLILAEYGADDDNPDAEYIYGLDGLLAKVDRSYGYLWYYIDHLGSLRYLEEHAGSGLVMRRDYYPYGQNKTAAGDTASDYQFTGKELDKHTGLYYFSARYYDPSIGRWYVIDPAGQGWSPYVYCGGNPIIYVDPDGRWFIIDDLIAGFIGGTVNLVSNLIQGNVDNFWEGLGYFGAGAAQGTLSLYGPAGWAAGGAIVGGSNAALGGARGWDIIKGAGIGAASGLVGGSAGQWAARNLGGVVINGFHIGSPVAKGIVGGALGGAVGSYAGGFTGGFLMTGDLSQAHQVGLGGLYGGLTIGGIAGGISGYAWAKSNDLNPWTGKPDRSVTIGRDMKNWVNLRANDLGSETISNDWPPDVPGRSQEGLNFNDQWIKIKIEEGYYIYDAGTSTSPPTFDFSPNYNLELNAIQNYNRTYKIYYYKKINAIYYR